MLDPSAMLVFATLSRAGGVRGAAAMLGIPRSTVSRRLAALEAEVGAPLVVRTARRFVLTDLGVALAARCGDLEELLARTNDIVHRATGEPSGVLRVAAAPVLGEEVLPEIIAELTRRHPALGIEVRMSVDYVDLRKSGVDVALRATAGDDGMDLFAVRIGTSTTGCWASPKYIAARGEPRTPEELRTHECLLVGSTRAMTWSFKNQTREVRVPVMGRTRLDSLRLARDLAARGVGIVRVPRLFVEPLAKSGALVPVLERHWPTTPLYAVHASGNPPPPKVRAFIDLARKVVGRKIKA
jgi:DNA-binding transcriptional LysR family regulator